MTSLAPPSLLVADNYRFLVNLIRSVCSGIGFNPVYTAHSAEDAARVFNDHKPDMVIVGRDLPPLTGLGLINQYRDPMASPAPMVPIIFISSFAEAAEVLAARDCGVHELLATPLVVKTLFQRVKDIIEQPRDFIMSADYFGPDRRRGTRPPPDGERRKGGKTNRVDAVPTVAPTSQFARNFRKLGERMGRT